MRAAALAFALAGCALGDPAAPDAGARDAAALKVACDGALCKTDNGGSCAAGAADPSALVGVGAALAALVRRRQVGR
ncbi:MAG TPA: hypothetical protein VLX92_12235 [Kofleriaceae bacterium]|nr:hypothetical protein [Kofleriaceae bacterium]